MNSTVTSSITMIIFLFLTVFCGIASGYGGYGQNALGYGPPSEALYEVYSDSREHRRPKKKCKKLRHFVFETYRDYHVNREPTYSYLERNGKRYVKISCSNNGQEHALIAEIPNKTVEIQSKVYDGAVLTAGYNIQYLAKCDEDEISATTTDWNKVKIEKVACLSYDTFDAYL